MPIQLIFKKYQFATRGIKTHTKSKVGFQPNLPATIVNTIHALNHGKDVLAVTFKLSGACDGTAIERVSVSTE